MHSRYLIKAYIPVNMLKVLHFIISIQNEIFSTLGNWNIFVFCRIHSRTCKTTTQCPCSTKTTTKTAQQYNARLSITTVSKLKVLRLRKYIITPPPFLPLTHCVLCVFMVQIYWHKYLI